MPIPRVRWVTVAATHTACTVPYLQLNLQATLAAAGVPYPMGLNLDPAKDIQLVAKVQESCVTVSAGACSFAGIVAFNCIHVRWKTWSSYSHSFKLACRQ